MARNQRKQGLIILLAVLVTSVVLCSSCSMGRMVADSTVLVLDGGLDAMNRETDLELARAAIPANLKLLEGLIIEAPGNLRLREYVAQGFYGYAFGFVEDEDPERASELYRRCLEHALAGLRSVGLKVDANRVHQEELEKAVGQLGSKAVPSLFWGASCWAKWIDMNRDDLTRVAEMGRAAGLMSRVLDLDETYYYGGPHVFFGVYYGSRPPMLGGDYEKAAQHFEKAHTISGGRAFIVDVMYAQYLERQKQDKQAFHEKLSGVVHQSAAQTPDLALANKISQRKAKALLAKEEAWF